jgi:hypothetical protein
VLTALATLAGRPHASGDLRLVDIHRTGALDDRLHQTSRDEAATVVALGASEDWRV